MKKYMLILTGFSALAIGSCTAQKKTTSKSQNGPAMNAVTMERSACFGRCPIYSIEIRKDGMVTYKGKRFTEYTGIYTKNIGAAKAGDILKEFRSYRADTCKAQYETLVTDVPGLHYILAVDTGNKMIRNANFGPRFLKLLGANIDQQIKVDNSWTKVSDKVE